MSDPKKTHRVVNKPQISAQLLSDYMAASERAKRTIVQKCRFPAIARLLQHQEAKAVISKYYRHGGDRQDLYNAAHELYGQLADDDYYRELYDVNADYLTVFAGNLEKISLPKADILNPGKCPAININGTKVTPDIAFRLMRVTKTNEIRIGATVLRYAKNKALPAEVAAWHSSFIFGYLQSTSADENENPEKKLCVTIDGWTGETHPAPGNAITRFENIKAACSTIAENWQNIPLPNNAVV